MESVGNQEFFLDMFHLRYLFTHSFIHSLTHSVNSSSNVSSVPETKHSPWGDNDKPESLLPGCA